MLFFHQCKRTGLDPFSRQIHAVKRWDAQMGREVMSIQTGIDGYRLIADRTGLYAGNDDPVYDEEGRPHPGKATVTVYKLVNGARTPFTRSARWTEFAQTKKDGSLTRFWAKMPYLMLGKVAEALALRAAFPQELSGLYTNDEMPPADESGTTSPVVVTQPTANGKPKENVADMMADSVREQFKGCTTIEDLLHVWNSVRPDIQAMVVGDKDAAKNRILTAGRKSNQSEGKADEPHASTTAQPANGANGFDPGLDG